MGKANAAVDEGGQQKITSTDQPTRPWTQRHGDIVKRRTWEVKAELRRLEERVVAVPLCPLR